MSPPVIISGSAHPALGSAIGRQLETATLSCGIERFPDGEILVEVGTVRGRDVFIVQPLGPPVGESILELVLLADACRRGDARSVSAVVSYLGYARQERRAHEGEPLGAHVVARLLSISQFSRLFALDLHAAAVEGFFDFPVEHLGAVPLLADAVAARSSERAVVVSPDFGGAKRARRFATRLGLPLAIVHKTRVSGSDVSVHGVVGDVRGLRPIIVDDMISTGGTIAAAVQALLAAGATPEVTVAATHGLFVGPAAARLRDLPITRFLVTDSLPPRADLPLRVEVVSVAPLLATAIRRLSSGEPLGDLLATD